MRDGRTTSPRLGVVIAQHYHLNARGLRMTASWPCWKIGASSAVDESHLGSLSLLNLCL